MHCLATMYSVTDRRMNRQTESCQYPIIPYCLLYDRLKYCTKSTSTISGLSRAADMPSSI